VTWSVAFLAEQVGKEQLLAVPIRLEHAAACSVGTFAD
jgi:hypothetical protein